MNNEERAALVARLQDEALARKSNLIESAANMIESDGRKLARIEQAAHEVDCGTSEALQESLVNAIDAILEGGDDEQ